MAFPPFFTTRFCGDSYFFIDVRTFNVFTSGNDRNRRYDEKSLYEVCRFQTGVCPKRWLQKIGKKNAKNICGPAAGIEPETFGVADARGSCRPVIGWLRIVVFID